MTLTFYDCATAPSPRRARIALAEKGVPHDTVQVDLRSGEQFSPEFRTINPNCTVPVLRLDDGTVISENAGILAWLDAAHPTPPLLGTTPVERGQVAAWSARVEFEGLMAVAEALRNGSPAMKNRATTGPTDHAQIPALAERGLKRLAVFFDMLDDRLGGREFVAVDEFSAADIVAGVVTDFARVVKSGPTDQHTNVNRWRESLAKRPSFSL